MENSDSVTSPCFGAQARTQFQSFVLHPFHSYFTCCLIYLITSVAACKYIYPIATTSTIHTTTTTATAWIGEGIASPLLSHSHIHNSGWLYTSEATLYSCMAISLSLARRRCRLPPPRSSAVLMFARQCVRHFQWAPVDASSLVTCFHNTTQRARPSLRRRTGKHGGTGESSVVIGIPLPSSLSLSHARTCFSSRN